MRDREFSEVRYLYDTRRRKRKAHIAGTDGRTLCQMENGSATELTNCGSLPEGRMICGICSKLHADGLTVAHRRTPLAAAPRAGVVRAKESAHDFYTSYQWAEARYKVLKASEGKCLVCGTRENLTVDHIKPVAKYPELRLDLNNLQVMCRLCNRGKGRWDETDWRQLDNELTPDQSAHMRDILYK